MLALNSTIPLEAVFYLVRNGLGETYQALSDAQSIFVQTQNDQISQSIALYYMYLIVAFLILIISSCFVLIFISTIRKSAIGISTLLLKNSVSVYFNQKWKSAQRLQERYEFELDSSIERAFKGARPVRAVYHPTFQLGLIFAFFWCLCGGFYCSVYFRLFSDLSDELITMPVMTNSDITRLVNMIETEIWVNELMLQQAGHPWSKIVPDKDYIPSPVLRLKNSQAIVKLVASITFAKITSGFQVTQAHFTFTYDYTYLKSWYFQYGFRIGTKAYTNDINCCVNAGYQYCPSEIPRLVATGMELASYENGITSRYHNDCQIIIEATVALIITLMSVFSLLLLILLLCFFAYLKYRIDYIGKALLKLCSMIHSGKEGSESQRHSIVVENSTHVPPSKANS